MRELSDQIDERFEEAEVSAFLSGEPSTSWLVRSLGYDRIFLGEPRDVDAPQFEYSKIGPRKLIIERSSSDSLAEEVEIPGGTMNLGYCLIPFESADAYDLSRRPPNYNELAGRILDRALRPGFLNGEYCLLEPTQESPMVVEFKASKFSLEALSAHIMDWPLLRTSNH